MLTSASTIVLMAFAALASAAPTSSKLIERAGGPIAKPVPLTCNVNYPIRLFSGLGYIPNPSTKDAQLYAAYYPSPSSDKAAMAIQCQEQCYGYGDSTQCKAAFWAENVEVPAGYFGSPGGTYNTACIMYTRELGAADFELAPGGKGTTPFAVNIQC